MQNKIRCLITAGPTREFFDPVRFISNPSSGKMGYALAEAAIQLGWGVDLVSGPVALPAPPGANLYPVVTGAEMLAQVRELFPHCDILIKTAAVCDMRPKQFSDQKVKKGELSMTLEMEPTPDILKTISAEKNENQVLVGFAAETEDIEKYARKKMKEKNLDWIVANKVGGQQSAFESDSNTVTLLGRNSKYVAFGPDTKQAVASFLLSEIKVNTTKKTL